MSEADIKKLLGTEHLIIGTDRVRKMLKQGTLEKVFLASNVNPHDKQDLQQHASLSNVEVELLHIPNEELGILCKKGFPVSVLGKRK